jgi:NAD(P)-dependent dehydrogenase (short-subunit alcohol dehydrogenase family)
MAEFGRIDVCLVNHGIWAIAPSSWELSEEDWQESIDVLLTAVWKTTKAFVPKIIEGGRGGSVILTASVMGQNAQPSSVAYTAAKHGVLGIMRTLAWEAGRHGIRCNAIMPGNVDTPRLQGGTIAQSLEWEPRFFGLDRALLPDGMIPPDGIARAAVFLASDDSQYMTGAAVPVDAGWSTF